MVKAPLVLLLFSLPGFAQVPTATFQSTPVFSHGVPLSLAQDPAHSVILLSRIRGAIRKRYLQVFVGIHNTGMSRATEFNPSGIVLTAGNSGYFLPMNAAEVQEMAKGAAHHQILGAIGMTPQPAFGDSSATDGNPNPQAYQQSPTDGMYDAAFEDAETSPNNLPKTNLTHADIAPGDKLQGFVYFDLGKNGADPESFKGYALKIPLGDQVYQMDFKTTAAAAPASAPHSGPALASKPIDSRPAASTTFQLEVDSDPDQADIDLDGKFVVQTPMLVPLPPGDHTIRLIKSGFAIWEKKIHATGDNAVIDATLKRQMIYRAH